MLRVCAWRCGASKSANFHRPGSLKQRALYGVDKNAPSLLRTPPSAKGRRHRNSQPPVQTLLADAEERGEAQLESASTAPAVAAGAVVGAGATHVEQSHFAKQFAAHVAAQDASGAYASSSYRAGGESSRASSLPSVDAYERQQHESAVWFEQAPKIRMARRKTVHGDGVPVFGEDARRHKTKEGRKEQRKRAVAGPASVDVPLLPVNYLRRRAYTSSDANGDVTAEGLPLTSDATARVHAQIQKNMLRQVKEPQLFVCRSCGEVVEAKPEDLLKEGTTWDLAGPAKRCPGCKGTVLQWLVDRVHRTTHARLPDAREGAVRHGADADGERKVTPSSVSGVARWLGTKRARVMPRY